MSVMTDRRSVAANATVQNALAGKVHEFLSEDSLIRVAAVAAAVGMNVSVLVGAEVLVDDQEISAANRYPVIPDDVVAEGAGFGGDRLILRYRNTTGGAIVIQSILGIEPA